MVLLWCRCGVLTGLAVGQPTFSSFPLPTSAFWSAVRFVIGVVVLLGVFFGCVALCLRLFAPSVVGLRQRPDNVCVACSLRVLEKKFAAPRSHLATLLRFCRYGSVPPVILLVVPGLLRPVGL